MVYTLITHKVEDVKKWTAAFEGFYEYRKSMGEKWFQVFSSSDNPNQITVLNGWETMEKAKAFLDTEELKNKMKEAGVAEEPRIYFLEELLAPAFAK